MPTGVWWGAGVMHPRVPCVPVVGVRDDVRSLYSVARGGGLQGAQRWGCVCGRSAKGLNRARNVGGKAHGWFSWQECAAGVWALGRSAATDSSWLHRSGLMLALLSGFLWVTSGFG